MTTYAAVFKDSVRRLARKEIKAENKILKRAVARFRHDIADLKRTIAGLQKQIQRGPVIKQAKISDADLDGVRFSAKSIRSQRKRLGLSAADFGKLVGASALTVYHWEQGKAKPRREKMVGIVAVRKLGRREAQARLEE